jgi:hypothetical protein
VHETLVVIDSKSEIAIFRGKDVTDENHPNPPLGHPLNRVHLTIGCQESRNDDLLSQRIGAFSEEIDNRALRQAAEVLSGRGVLADESNGVGNRTSKFWGRQERSTWRREFKHPLSTGCPEVRERQHHEHNDRHYHRSVTRPHARRVSGEQ